MKLLEIKEVNKSYKLAGKEKIAVLSGVNLSFSSGEFVSILGESGSGKSTLMNIIGGMDSDYEGEVIVQGKSLRSMKEKEIDAYRKNKIGFIFQSFNLIPHLTVLENVTIAMQMMDKSEKERNRRALEILEEVGLKGHVKKRPNQLSGGQKQRVAIARALANDPDIILADEPTGALDQETSEQILDLLDSIAQKGVLIITVTHSQRVADFGSRIVRVEDGSIREDQALKERYNSEKKSVDKKGKSLSFLASFKLAIRNMQLKAKRNLLVALGASIGISSVLLMLSLGNGVTGYINDQINSSTNPLLIDVVKSAGGNVKAQGGPPAERLVGDLFTEEDVAKISGIKDVKSVEKATTIREKSNMVYGSKNYGLPALQTVTDSVTESNIEAGTLPSGNEVMLSTGFAQRLTNEQAYGSFIGKSVKLFVNEMSSSNQPVIVEKELTVSGIYKQADRGPVGGADAYVAYSTLEEAYNQQNISLNPLQINAYAADVNDVEHIKSDIESAGFVTSPTTKLMKQLTTYINLASWLLAAIAGISLLVSGIMILIVLYVSVVERTREIGILRAIGARKKDIQRIFFSESALIGLLSGGIAVVGSVLISFVLNMILNRAFGVELIQLTPQYMLFGIGISTLISVVAGLLPSSKAAKLDPMESLRYE
ncbi:ABC transporter ATP-binding protein/permease [Paenibacillus sp. URB8-2]|uniref:ABC transporter ATP-binding protein/permease n=1 Tax=Paenibacillus sp. URB8-2 TaxID=2741301 RepID=UPI0015B8539E|nr:ABC transporter ATP-binding protein/permease [Paenibacillus sp. URB8-2]BCG56992.1 ABC transporter ATP-binding protein [Paenibacillus sp. URB8-2]